ncbi:MAG: hypothetical protein NW217_15240 [Hyphomicrobiaceae bacterium]|nr:hypothetical protein [Hyphomicrobiaceae bacterium]
MAIDTRACRHDRARAAIAVGLSAALAAGPAASLSAASVTPYDYGYAMRAGQSCPDLELIAPPPDAIRGEPDFARGVAIVETYLARLGLDVTCRFAANLYESQSGKVARLLRRK